MSTVNHCEAPGLMPLEKAVEAILAAVVAISETESISLHSANKRVLANNVVSAINVPPADNSAMDGYALRSADLTTTNTLELIGTTLAGAPFQGKVDAGQCIRIMTGGVLPQGADCVVMQENAQADVINNKNIRFLQQCDVGNNVRKAGEDITQGQVVVAKGCYLTPAHLALIASVGQAKVEVVRQLTVGLISTGDELILPGQTLIPGAIYESNSYALAAMLHNLNIKVNNYGIVKDDLSSLREVFKQADDECDLVISCGGVSVGEADFVKDILAEAGEVNFWKVAIKPGKPFAFGRLAKAWFCGLPGNPVSSYVTFEQLVLPLLKKLGGQNITTKQKPYFVAKAANLVRKRPGRADFQRAYFYRDDSGLLWVKAQSNQGSGVMSSITSANCYIVLAQEQNDVSIGQELKILPFSNIYSD